MLKIVETIKIIYNIKMFTEKENVQTQSHHSLWSQNGFEYTGLNKGKENEIVYTFESFRIAVSFTLFSDKVNSELCLYVSVY